jgi:hypothetical protein
MGTFAHHFARGARRKGRTDIVADSENGAADLFRFQAGISS